jgi:hypothetical protein
MLVENDIFWGELRQKQNLHEILKIYFRSFFFPAAGAQERTPLLKVSNSSLDIHNVTLNFR